MSNNVINVYLPVFSDEDSVGMIRIGVIIWIHLRFTQHCFLVPFPPYFGLSKHCLLSPQSCAWHPQHC